jgi:hypothetical protein
MIKMLIFIKRRPGLSRADFQEYYETRHVPLISRYLAHHMEDYRRSYIDPDDPYTFTGAFDTPEGGATKVAEPEFDVLTEIWLRDRTRLEEMYAALREENLARRIAEDEQEFMDRGAMRVFVSTEYSSN